MRSAVFVGIAALLLGCQDKAPMKLPSPDFNQLQRYQSANASLMQKEADSSRIVLLGNSITEGWLQASPAFFENEHLVNRGIGGQTSIQMLGRFRADVINLQPQLVVILAGTNDIAGNTGDVSLEEVRDNVESMVELAKANGITPLVCSVLPAADFPWRAGKNPAERIPALNTLLKEMAENHQVPYVDYYSAMANTNNGLDPVWAYDGVHPTAEGYGEMEKVLIPVLDQLLPEWKP